MEQLDIRASTRKEIKTRNEIDNVRQMRVNCIEIAKTLEDKNVQLSHNAHNDIASNELCY